MTNKDSYRTIKSISNGIYKEKGSRFIAEAIPVKDEDEIRSAIERIRKEHHDARHNCYAWVLGPDGERWRTNDDGEPSGTAGKPILGQIRKKDLKDIIIIVSRYFGGTLLGVSGLINAYRSAAESAISAAEITEHVMQETWEIKFPYSAMNDVMKIIKEEKISQSEFTYDPECKIKISLRLSVRDKALKRFSRIDGFSYTFLSIE